jgi:aminoglycoside 3-N-acetyltransferase
VADVRQVLTSEDISAGLRGLGLKGGDRVLLHSSLSSMGWVEGGADAVIDALLATIGVRGTLMVPTFTHDTTLFDVASTPSRTGLITETLRRRPGTKRSWHPTHSVAAWGADAVDLTAHHARAFGVGSPIARMASLGGVIVLIGVTLRYCSAIHVAENHARVPYLGKVGNPIREAKVITPEGKQIGVTLKDQPACGAGFGQLEPILHEHGLVSERDIGQARCQRIPARALIDIAAALMRKDPGALLCHRPHCLNCPRSREIIASSGGQTDGPEGQGPS